MKRILTLLHLFVSLQKRMRAHVWFENTFVLLLHENTTLSTEYDMKSILKH